MSQLRERDATLPYHHVRIPYRKIAIGPDRPWLVRGSEVKQGVATDDLHALQESIQRFDLLDPLLVLLDDGDSPLTLGDDSQSAIEEWLQAEGNEVEIVGGYRRLIALRRHLNEHRIEVASVEVRLVLRSELTEANNGHWKLALTKVVASSNAFFKEYSAADKLKLTRKLIELIDVEKGDRGCTHTNILNLMGEASRVSGKQSAGYRASLRRFKIARNARLYRAVLGMNPEDPASDTPCKEHQTVDRQLAEEIATQLDNDPEAIDKILDKIEEDIGKFTRKKRDTPPHRQRQYKKNKYLRNIKEARLGHELDDSTEEADGSPFRYDLRVDKRKISIPSVRIDLSKKTDETFEKLVEVAYKIDQASKALTNAVRQLYLVRGQSAIASNDVPELPGVYDPNKYGEFIYRYKAEQFAQPGELVARNI